MNYFLKTILSSTHELTSSPYYLISLFILISIILIEPLSHWNTIFGKVGTILWIYLFIFIAIEAIKAFKTLITYALQGSYPYTIFAYSLIMIISIIGTTLPINSHFEAAQEIACKLAQFSLSDFGYNATCHLGYPARIFLIPSIPSLVFGPSLIALNLGGWIYIFCGVTIFTNSLIKYFHENQSPDIVIFFSLALLPNFFHFNYFLFAYELGIFPTVLMLAQTGFYLSYLKEKKIKYILLLLIINYYLIFSYTTALAIVALSIFLLLLFIFEKKIPTGHKHILKIGIIATIILCICSLFTRNDIRIFHGSESSINIPEELFNAIGFFINGHIMTPFSTSVISLIIFVVILSLLSFQFGKKYFIIGVWIIAVIITAIISAGYFFNPLEFRIHRALIILPPIVVFASIIVNRILSSIPSGKIIIIIFSIFLLILGTYYQYKYLDTKVGDERHRHYELINYLKTNITNGDEIYLYFDINTENKFLSINDNLRYYYKKSGAEVINNICNISGYNSLVSNTYFLTYSEAPCIGYSTNFSLIGSYTFLNDSPLYIFEIQSNQ